MKILYYFPEEDTNMYRWQRVHFFDELSRYDIEFETFNPLVICRSWEEANEQLLKKIRNGKFDLFFTCKCNEQKLFIETLEEIKKLGIPTLSFRPDNLTIPFNDQILGPHFDLLWLTAKETKYLYDKWNIKTFFAPYAANPFTYRNYEEPLIRKVCFIGTPHGSRARMINHLTTNKVETDLYYTKKQETSTAADNTIKYENPLKTKPAQTKYDMLRFKEGRKLLLGKYVNRFVGSSDLAQNENLFIIPSVPFEELGIKYSSYALSLSSTSNGHTDVLPNPLKIINLRNFEVPMCGGIEFCRYNPELAEYFEEGKEIVFYHNKEEMIDKARYYTQKASDNELKEIMHAARRRAESDHTWIKRFSIAFDIFGLKEYKI